MKRLIAPLVFIILIALAVTGGFASKSIHASSLAADSGAAISDAYNAMERPGWLEIGVIALACLFVSRARWKATDRS